MYGLFTLNKNNQNTLLFLFKNDKHLTFTNRIFGWDMVDSFNPKVLQKCQKYVEEHYFKPYKLHYHNCKDQQDLASLCKNLQIDPKNAAVRLDKVAIDLLSF